MSYAKLWQILILVLLFCSIFLLLFQKSYCKNSLLARSTLGRIPIFNQVKINPGYTLLSPFNLYNELPNKKHQQGTVYLVDLYGKPVHSWKTSYQPFHSTLKKNGNLVVALIAPNDFRNYPTPGYTGIVQELSWDGQILWEYKNSMLHHDFEVLPNGNIATLVWEKIPEEIATSIKGGVEGTEFKGDQIWSDAIIEINKKGEVVWIWHAYEQLDPQIDLLGSQASRAEWTHANSIRFLDKDPFEGKQSYLISFANINEIALIDKESGKIIKRSDPLMLGYQHDPTLLKNGNILVFDNGFQKKPQPRPFASSRVLEIDPKKNRIVWDFTGGTGIDTVLFSSNVAGGAQRLENGNTLITESTRGRILEVTQNKEVVWDFINPHTAFSTGSLENNFIFKARRYGLTEISWPEKLSSPQPLLSRVCQKII